jgi:hypothetical protein
MGVLVCVGDEEYLYVIEMPPSNPFDELTEWTVKASERSGPSRWNGVMGEAFERASWQCEESLESALEEILTESV